MQATSIQLVSKASPILFSFLWLVATCFATYYAIKDKKKVYLFPYLLVILVMSLVLSSSLLVLTVQWVDGNFANQISFVDHQWNAQETGIAILAILALHYHYLLMHKIKHTVDVCKIPLISQMKSLDFKTLCLIIASSLIILFFIGFMVLALTGNLDALKIYGEILNKGIDKGIDKL